jgi:aminopeptidase N
MIKTVALVVLFSALPVAYAAVPPPPQGKLPDTVKPAEYRLDLTIDPSTERFSGHTEIDASLTRPTRTVFLHGNGLTVTSARIIAGQKTVTTTYTEVDPTGVARLDLSGTLPAGKVTFVFDYTAGFRTSAEGLFHAKVGNDWYAWTQFESIDARRMFPGFDEPGFKTPFKLNITVPREMKAFSNSPETGTTPSGTLVTHHFAPTKPLPTYLVAVGVGPFDVVETTVPPDAFRSSPLPFRVIATKGQAARMRFAAAEAPKLLVGLETYFQSAYPFDKLDFLASPIQQGAMENAGLIIFDDSYILLDADAPIRQLTSFGDVCAHEMAHQWVGDLVTPTWWTDIWLNESFAEWMGNKVANQWRPDLGIAASELADTFGAMDDDALGHGRPIHQPITRNTEIDSAFDSITYLKGAQVLSMFETYLGPDNFARGVRLHLSRHRYGNATADDFFQSLGEAAGNPQVVPAMRTFTDQTGVPLVTVASTAQGLTLSQARYQPLGAPAGTKQSWMIPVCLARGEQHSCTLLSTSTASIAPFGDPKAALMPNAAGAGYYRFSLDHDEWERLINAAPTLPGREAMALANSLWAQFTAGRVGFDLVVAGARALTGSSERLAVVELAQRLQGLANTLLKPEQLPAYGRLMDSIYGPKLEALGTDVSGGSHASEPAPRRALRESLLTIVALDARQPKLRGQLAASASAYLSGNSKALDPAFRRTALIVAAQDGGAPVLAQLKHVLLTSSDPLLKIDATVAIGFVDTPALAENAMAIATSAEISTNETETIFALLARQPGSRDAANEYTRANVEQLADRLPGISKTLLVQMYSGYCEEPKIAALDAFYAPNRQRLGGGELEAAQTRERIALCAALKSSKGDEIASVLAQ